MLAVYRDFCENSKQILALGPKYFPRSIVV